MENKQELKYILAICIVVLLFFFTIYGIRTQEKDYYKKTGAEIGLLQSKIDSLERDKSSLLVSIDSLTLLKDKVDSTIIIKKQYYEKSIDSILTQSTSDDVLFFSKYLSESDWGFIGSDN